MIGVFTLRPSVQSKDRHQDDEDVMESRNRTRTSGLEATGLHLFFADDVLLISSNQNLKSGLNPFKVQ